MTEQEWLASTARIIAKSCSPEVAMKWAEMACDAHGPNGDLTKLTPKEAARLIVSRRPYTEP